MTDPLYFVPADSDEPYEEVDKYGNPISGDSLPYCCKPDKALSRTVESISQSVELCASKRDLDYKIQDVKNLCDWVHKQNPYRRRH